MSAVPVASVPVERQGALHPGGHRCQRSGRGRRWPRRPAGRPARRGRGSRRRCTGRGRRGRSRLGRSGSGTRPGRRSPGGRARRRMPPVRHLEGTRAQGRRGRGRGWRRRRGSRGRRHPADRRRDQEGRGAGHLRHLPGRRRRRDDGAAERPRHQAGRDRRRRRRQGVVPVGQGRRRRVQRLRAGDARRRQPLVRLDRHHRLQRHRRRHPRRPDAVRRRGVRRRRPAVPARRRGRRPQRRRRRGRPRSPTSASRSSSATARPATASEQEIVVPDGAKTLYLGFADGYGFFGAPGAYGDNEGTVDIEVTIDWSRGCDAHAGRPPTVHGPDCEVGAHAASAPVSQPVEEVALKAIQSGFESQRGHAMSARAVRVATHHARHHDASPELRQALTREFWDARYGEQRPGLERPAQPAAGRADRRPDARPRLRHRLRRGRRRDLAGRAGLAGHGAWTSPGWRWTGRRSTRSSVASTTASRWGSTTCSALTRRAHRVVGPGSTWCRRTSCMCRGRTSTASTGGSPRRSRPDGRLLVVAHHPDDVESGARRPHGPGLMFPPEQLLATLGVDGGTPTTGRSRSRTRRSASSRCRTGRCRCATRWSGCGAVRPDRVTFRSVTSLSLT